MKLAFADPLISVVVVYTVTGTKPPMAAGMILIRTVS
jgi:hypothetical protein